MRTLVYLEPLWFRGSSAFLRPHIELFILPMLKALQDRSGSAEICIVSNIILSLEMLAALRKSNIDINRVSIFSINSTHALADCEFRPDIYAADLFRTPKKGSLVPFQRRVLNRSLFKRIAQAFREFRPDIVVTTAQNRYVRQLCDDTSIPLLSSEFGPLPRIPYPSNRFLSLDGHLSDGPFHSVKDLRQALKTSTAEGRDGSYLANFLERYHAAVSVHEQYNACRDFIKQIAREGRVAMLALQPEHWLTWEGPLTHAQGPAPIILRALGAMSADRLIVTFHPTPEGHVVGDQFTEIWLSNPTLVRLPPNLAVNTSEIFLPFVDEVITVSSNVAMSAFLLGKRIKAIGNSYVGTLAKLSADGGATLGLREDVAQYLDKHYCVSNEIFSSAPHLNAVIQARIKAKFGLIRPPHASTLEIDRNIVHPSDSLELIHEKIKAYISDNAPINRENFLKMFGRNAIGYLAKNGSIGAELGVAAALFSDSLLMSGNFGTLYSVDIWGDHHDDDEFRIASERLLKHGDRSIVLRKSFDEALNLIPDGHLDFIYIDAYAHTGVAAQILKAWMPKLKNDAFVAGHDFCRVNWPNNHARLAEALESLGFKDVTMVPGVFTSNSDDIFPSFIASR